GEGRFGRQLGRSGFGPGEERVEQRCRLPAVFNPLGDRRKPGFVLDGIDRGDSIERLLGDRRLRRFPHVEYFSSAMSPAGNFRDRAWLAAGGSVQRLETGVAIGLEKTGECGHVGRRMLATTIRAVEISRGGRGFATEWP